MKMQMERVSADLAVVAFPQSPACNEAIIAYNPSMEARLGTVLELAESLKKRPLDYWRYDPAGQFYRGWYRTWVVHFFLGSTFGLCRKLNTDIKTMGWTSRTQIAIWIYEVRKPTEEEYQMKFLGKR